MTTTYDYAKLLGRIREKRLTQSELARKIKISETSLNLSLNNKRPFKQSEISKICDVLLISNDNLESYFFAKTL